MSRMSLLRQLPLYAVAFLGHVGFGLLFPVIPVYAEGFTSSLAIVGLAVGMFSYVAALTMIPFGTLSDRLGRRTILVVGLAMFTVAPLLYILIANPWQLILVRAFHGLAAATFVPPANALVVEMSPPERRGEALGWFTSAIMVGFIVGPVTGGFLLNLYGFDSTFYASSAVSLVALLLILPWLRGMGVKAAAMVEAVDSPWGWLRQRRAIGALLTVLFTVFGSGTIVAFMPLHGAGIGVTASEVGIVIIAMYASSTVVRAPGGILSDRMGREMVILFGFLVSAASIAFYSLVSSFPLLVVVGIAYGLGMGLAMTASFALVADVASLSARGLAMGAANSSLQAGLAIGATAMGGVAAATGFQSMFAICGAILAAALLAVLFLVGRGSK